VGAFSARATTNSSPTTDFSAAGTVTDDDATLALVPLASLHGVYGVLAARELRRPEEQERAGFGLRKQFELTGELVLLALLA
jgi:hypothetical protein